MPHYSVEFVDRPAKTLRVLLRELRRLPEKGSEDDGNCNKKRRAHVGAPNPGSGLRRYVPGDNVVAIDVAVGSEVIKAIDTLTVPAEAIMGALHTTVHQHLIGENTDC
jgi:hypothetical protein